MLLNSRGGNAKADPAPWRPSEGGATTRGQDPPGTDLVPLHLVPPLSRSAVCSTLRPLARRASPPPPPGFSFPPLVLPSLNQSLSARSGGLQRRQACYKRGGGLGFGDFSATRGISLNPRRLRVQSHHFSTSRTDALTRQPLPDPRGGCQVRGQHLSTSRGINTPAC